MRRHGLFAALLLACCACGGAEPSSGDLGVPADSGVEASADAGPCVALCSSCSFAPCESHCLRDCADAATLAGTCEAFLACIMDPPP